MRLGVVSDIHGNLAALDAVLDALATEDVEAIVNLGDLFSGGVQPGETARRLRSLDHLVIRGNHERQLLDSPLDQLGLSDRLAQAELTAEDMDWIGSLPTRIELAHGVVAVHGSPRSDMEYLLETVTPSGARPATTDEVVERLGDDREAALLLCGHTHIQRLIQVPGGPLIVNPGSVGWPAYADDLPYPHVMESGSPQARYAVVEWDRHGWRAKLRAVDYDWQSAATIAESNGRPDVAYSLRTGRAPH